MGLEPTTLASLGGSPLSHMHTISDLSDLPTVGRDFLAASSKDEQRSILGVDPAGLANLLVSVLDAEDVGAAPTVHTHVVADLTDSTAAGRDLLSAASVGAQRTLLNVDVAGTAATLVAGVTLGSLGAAAASHHHSVTDLTEATAPGLALLTAGSVAAQRTALHVDEAGTAATLVAAITPGSIGAAPAVHSHVTTDLTDSTSAGRAILTASTSAAQRGLLGVDPSGTAATLIAAITPGSIGAAPASHTHSVVDLYDSTASGRSLLLAVSPAAQRTLLNVDEAGTAAALVAGVNLASLGAAAAVHTHIATDITDSTVAGRSLLTAASNTAQRTILGAEAAGTAAALVAAITPASIGASAVGHTHPSTDISDSTSLGRSVLTSGSQASARTALGVDAAGTAATLVAGVTVASIGAAAAVHTHVATDISDSTAVGRTLLKASNAGAQLTAIGAAPLVHTHVVADLTDSTAAGRAVLTAADASAQRTALGIANLLTNNDRTTLDNLPATVTMGLTVTNRVGPLLNDRLITCTVTNRAGTGLVGVSVNVIALSGILAAALSALTVTAGTGTVDGWFLGNRNAAAPLLCVQGVTGTGGVFSFTLTALALTISGNIVGTCSQVRGVVAGS